MTSEVIASIISELEYQEVRWPNHSHSVAEWILIMEKCLRDAKRKWYACEGNEAALHEVRQVVAVGVKCMSVHGAPPRGLPLHCPAGDGLFATQTNGDASQDSGSAGPANGVAERS